MVSGGALLEWFGCATFRLRTAEGLIVFLDAYLDRAPSATQSGLSPEDVEDADWILVGHSHFDHLYGAERLAPRTGASVVGSYETTRVLANAGVDQDQLLAVSGGERIELDKHTSVRVLPGLHACAWSDHAIPPLDEPCVGELGVAWHERTRRLEQNFWPALGRLAPDIREHVDHASVLGERGDGGVLTYVLDTSEGSLLFQDTVGGWSALLTREHADVAILAAAGRGNLDGEPVQCSTAEFVARQATWLGAGRVVPCHHDDWLPGLSRPTETTPLHDALARTGSPAAVLDLEHAVPTQLFPASCASQQAT